MSMDEKKEDLGSSHLNGEALSENGNIPPPYEEPINAYEEPSNVYTNTTFVSDDNHSTAL